jgi:hypothetical protein
MGQHGSHIKNKLNRHDNRFLTSVRQRMCLIIDENTPILQKTKSKTQNNDQLSKV